jgi:MFS family permease
MTEKIEPNSENDILHEDIDTSVWRDWYLVVQFMFYFSQGAGFAAILMINTFLRNLGYGEPGPYENINPVTLQTIMMIPWLIKIVFGILSDTVKVGKFGRRKPYILIAGLLGLIGWGLMPFYTEPHWSIMLVGMLVTGSVALGDTVLDSLGVDITPPTRRSYMQGVAWGARGGGAILTGIFLGIWGNDLGLSNSYLIIGSFTVVGIMSALLIKEAPVVPDVKLSDFGHEFKKGITWHVTLFDLVSGMGIALVSVLIDFMNVEINIDIGSAGVGTIGWGLVFFSIGQLVGALSIGGLGQRLNLMWIFIINAIVYAGIILSFIWLPWDFYQFQMYRYILYIIVAILGAVNGGYEVSQMRISQEFSAKVSRGSLTGTMYNWYNSISNVGQLSVGTLIIASLVNAGVYYPIAMQICGVALILSIIPGTLLIRKLKLNHNQ